MTAREMKESGVNWIGMAPVGWDVKPIKHCIEYRQGGAWGEDEITEEQSVKENVICIRVADFDYHHFCVQTEQPYTLRSYDRLTINKLLLQSGDILVEKSGGGEKTPVGRAIIFDKPIKALYANFLERFRLASNIVPQYFQYAWNSFYKLGHTRLYIKQTTGIQNLDFTKILSSEYILVPSVAEQTAITAFLDAKCAEIDSLTADIEKQIETLQEYKKSVIMEAVTKGLDPNVEMKDSGAGWIGSIPVGWQVEKVKFHLKRRTVRNPGDTEVLALYREYGIVPKNSRSDNHNVTSEDTSKYLFVRKGDFVLNKMKAWQGSVAVSDYEGIISPAYYVYEFTTKKVVREYFHYLLRGCYKNEFRRLSGGIREGQWDLPANAFENVLFLLPTIEEQSAIAKFLDRKCTEIDATILEKQNQLEVLAQYKQSLIYEYVTGKKAVPV